MATTITQNVEQTVEASRVEIFFAYLRIISAIVATALVVFSAQFANACSDSQAKTHDKKETKVATSIKTETSGVRTTASTEVKADLKN